MKCEEAMEAVADRLTGDLDATAVAALREHLEGCPGCAAEAAALQAMWEGLGTSGEVTPSAALRRRFDDMLRRETAAAERRASTADHDAIRPDRRTLQGIGLGLALAAALALSMGAGIYLGSTTASRRGAGDLAELRTEIQSLRSTVALALLSETSASERLSGVAYGRELQGRDRRVADALFERLLEDPNVNVRLAALDALSEVARRPDTRARLLESIPAQDSPLVQISAIDVLFEAAPGTSAAEADGDGTMPHDLARLADDPALDEVVRGYLLDRIERSSP